MCEHRRIVHKLYRLSNWHGRALSAVLRSGKVSKALMDLSLRADAFVELSLPPDSMIAIDMVLYGTDAEGQDTMNKIWLM